jgi:ribonuclease VapC
LPIEEVTLLLATPVPFDEAVAYVAASIYEKTRKLGLSFGDCACLALALSHKLLVVTAERDWDSDDVGVLVITIRWGRMDNLLSVMLEA